MLSGEPKKADKDNKAEKSLRPSPVKSKSDLKSPFSEPPAPPPQQPLPEKPDVAKALADPVIQPLLLRADTTRPNMASNGSPTRPDHSQALLILTQELKLAKDQIPSLEDRVKILETELQNERCARENAEERAQKLETASQADSMDPLGSEPIPIPGSAGSETDAQTRSVEEESPNLQIQLDRLRATMDEMKQHMEAYRRRAEIAESERDEVRQTLAEMVEQKRKDHARAERRRSRSRTSRETGSDPDQADSLISNGHALVPTKDAISVAALLEKAGVQGDQMLTSQHALLLRQLLAQHAPNACSSGDGQQETEDAIAVNVGANYNAKQQGAAMRAYAWYWGPTITVLVIGALAMAGLDKIETVHR